MAPLCLASATHPQSFIRTPHLKASALPAVVCTSSPSILCRISSNRMPLRKLTK
jgi:hypothetical protein